MRIKTHENEAISSINIKRSLNFWEFNSTFHCSELKYFKVFLVLRVRGKLFQSLAVLTAKGRPPSKVFCGGGTVDLNYNFWWSLRGYLSFFLWMCLNSEAVFHLSFWKQAHRIDVCFIVKGSQLKLLNNVTVRVVRGALRIMRAARFCIRRTLLSSILLHNVHTELAYIMSGFMTA